MKSLLFLLCFTLPVWASAGAGYQKKVEDCLWSKTGVLVPLKVAQNGRYIRVMLAVSCPTMKVVAEFEASSGKYSLVHVGELVD